MSELVQATGAVERYFAGLSETADKLVVGAVE